VEEQVHGTSHFVMQFDNIQINANTPNSDFDVPASSATAGTQQ